MYVTHTVNINKNKGGKNMKKKISVIALIMLLIITIAGGVQAYQSTAKNTSYSNVKNNTATDWINGIRKMESENLGLSETIDEDTLVSEGSNNIDVHMLKNTEYGAIVILGASDYGKQGQDTGSNVETTRRMDMGNVTGTTKQASSTGNKYGIYELSGYIYNNTWIYGYQEWVAGGGTTFIRETINPRYIDRYETATPKVGDATLETYGWHGSGSAVIATGTNCFFRGGSGVFYTSYTGATGNYYARAAVWCGEGL